MLFLASIAAFAVLLTEVQAVVRSEFESSAIAFNERSIDAAKLHARHENRLLTRATPAWSATHPGLKAAIDGAVARTASRPHYFWSGRILPATSNDDSVLPIAQKIATARGGTTLEQTVEPIESIMPTYDGTDPDREEIWQYASDEYAAQAAGAVFVVKGEDLRAGNVWESYEYPRLKRSKKVKTISEIKVHRTSTDLPHQIYPPLKGCDGVVFIDSKVVCPSLAKSYYGSLKKPVVTAATTAAKDGTVKLSTNGNTGGIATECTEIITGEFVMELFEKTQVCDAATSKGNNGKAMTQVKALLNSASNRNKLQHARLVKQKMKVLGKPLFNALQWAVLDSLVVIDYYQKTASATAAMTKQIDSIVLSATGKSPGLAAAWATQVSTMKPMQVQLLALLKKQIAEKVKEANENKKRNAACGAAPTGAGSPKAPRQLGLYSGAFTVFPMVRSSLEARAAAAQARRSGPKSAAAPSCPLKSAPQKKTVPRSKTNAKQPPAKTPRRPAKTPAKKPASPKKKVVPRPANRARRTPGKAKPTRRPSPKRKPKKVPKPTRRPKGKARSRKTRRK